MKGDPLENEERKPVLLGVVLSNVLGGKTQNPSLAWNLGRKFATQKQVELLAEEVVFVKSEVTALGTNPEGWLSGLLTGQILNILDGKEEKSDSKEGAEEAPATGKKGEEIIQ